MVKDISILDSAAAGAAQNTIMMIKSTEDEMGGTYSMHKKV
jgi:hypothetical protein